MNVRLAAKIRLLLKQLDRDATEFEIALENENIREMKVALTKAGATSEMLSEYIRDYLAFGKSRYD